jgi:aminomethyltransferase
MDPIMSDTPSRKTSLHDWHSAHGGRMVEFGGWSMPVQYSTIVDEHRAVRERVGLFDISHMGRLSFQGAGAIDWLERLTTNRVASLAAGQIQYSLIANDHGGIVDDILVYRLDDSPEFLVVCNASNRDKVVAHLERHRGPDSARLEDKTLQTAMIAVQGPKALATLAPLLGDAIGSMKYYRSMTVKAPFDATVSRTGYTGEDGFELTVPNDDAEQVWEAILESGKPHGILPCGLGARDTLRFEAAMPLYGHELGEEINPYSAGLGWVVKLDKGDFVGREPLTQFKKNPGRVRVGLALDGKRIAREGCVVLQGDRPVGAVTSGTFAPTLGKSLAMAYVDPEFRAVGTTLQVDVRGRREAANVVELPFYRRSG